MAEALVCLLGLLSAAYFRGPAVSGESLQLDIDQPTQPRFELPQACIRVKNALWELRHCHFWCVLGWTIRLHSSLAHIFMTSNARRELRLKAGARDERTLEAVSSTPLFGPALASRSL